MAIGEAFMLTDRLIYKHIRKVPWIAVILVAWLFTSFPIDTLSLGTTRLLLLASICSILFVLLDSWAANRKLNAMLRLYPDIQSQYDDVARRLHDLEQNYKDRKTD